MCRCLLVKICEDLYDPQLALAMQTSGSTTQDPQKIAKKAANPAPTTSSTAVNPEEGGETPKIQTPQKSADVLGQLLEKLAALAKKPAQDIDYIVMKMID